jgi:phospholipid transport system substrate-binding protein
MMGERAGKRAVAVAVAALLGLPGVGWATPTDDVKTTIDKVLKIVTDPALKPQARTRERRAEIRKTVGERFNFGEMAQRSLATHWRDRTPQEQREFVSLFTDLLEKSYVDKLESFSDEKILYLGEQVDGNTATVKTKIVTKKNVEIPIDYRLIRRDGKWEVYDVIIESVSLINNYRVQFNKIIRTKSYPELVRLMKVKLEGENVEGLAAPTGGSGPAKRP